MCASRAVPMVCAAQHSEKHSSPVVWRTMLRLLLDQSQRHRNTAVEQLELGCLSTASTLQKGRESRQTCIGSKLRLQGRRLSAPAGRAPWPTATADESSGTRSGTL